MAKKKTARKGTVVYLVLDKSGSMGAIQGATIEGVNHFLHETADADESALYYEIQFDDRIERRVQGQLITTVEDLTYDTYKMGGSTALLDAVGAAISDIGALETKPEKVVVVVMTDGMENASHEYTKNSVAALISKHESKDKWQFLFLGANMDAISEAGRIGMAAPKLRSSTFVHDSIGASAAYSVAAAATGSYLRGHSTDTVMTQDAYNAVDTSLRYGPEATSKTISKTTASTTTSAK